MEKLLAHQFDRVQVGWALDFIEAAQADKWKILGHFGRFGIRPLHGRFMTVFVHINGHFGGSTVDTLTTIVMGLSRE